jgi:phage terminase large subunit GpA-like protein
MRSGACSTSGESSERVSATFRRARQTAIPSSRLSVSAWAAAYRRLPSERADESGRWRNELVPYLVEMMDCIGRPGVREIVFVKSTQIGGTEAINNAIGYFMHIEPSPLLYLCENQGKAEAWSKECLTPTIRDTPVLSSLVNPSRTRDSGNTIGGKSFPGGRLNIAWATSPETVSSRPCRGVFMDERDGFEVTKEGDPAALAEERTVTFRERKFVVKVSTPRNRQEPEQGSAPGTPSLSPIELDYENSDKRRYWVPCPHCDAYQVLKWANVRWDSDDEAINAYYVCEHCACVIEHEHKTNMLARGGWRAEKPFRGSAGFHIWAGYSPFVTWGELAVKWLKAKKRRETLKVFVNTSLAEGWDEVRDQAEVGDLTERRDGGELIVPLGVVLLTFAADVQDNRIEVEVVGWGRDEESWSIDYKVFEGDPSRQDVWQKLETYLAQVFPCEWGGTMRLAAGAIDIGGHHTDDVYKFCHRHRGRRYYAVKGWQVPGKPLAPLKPTPQGRLRVPLYMIGTETAKDTIANHLVVVAPGPGYCHFPLERVDPETGRVYYGEDYFRQLRSERAVQRGNVRVWKKVREKERNEALDVRVYNMAAKAILKPDMEALAARVMRQIVELEAAAAAPPAEQGPEEGVEESEVSEAPEPRRYAARRARGSYVNRHKEW